MKKENIARVCHEVNRAFCMSIGDTSQKSWDECDEWQRESAIAGVTFKLANPDTTPEELHSNWCKDKYSAGWRWGDVKDADRKTHPCLVHYSVLPVEQRSKDYLFAAVVKTLSEMTEVNA